MYEVRKLTLGHSLFEAGMNSIIVCKPLGSTPELEVCPSEVQFIGAFECDETAEMVCGLLNYGVDECGQAMKLGSAEGDRPTVEELLGVIS